MESPNINALQKGDSVLHFGVLRIKSRKNTFNVHEVGREADSNEKLKIHKVQQKKWGLRETE